MAHRAERVAHGERYQDPIKCPICGKGIGTWEKGAAAIKILCKRCKKIVYIEKKLDFQKQKSQ